MKQVRLLDFIQSMYLDMRGAGTILTTRYEFGLSLLRRPEENAVVGQSTACQIQYHMIEVAPARVKESRESLCCFERTRAKSLPLSSHVAHS